MYGEELFHYIDDGHCLRGLEFFVCIYYILYSNWNKHNGTKQIKKKPSNMSNSENRTADCSCNIPKIMMIKSSFK